MELTEILREKSFWVATTIGTIALSIIANLLTPVIRSLFSKSSGRLSDIIIKKKVEEEHFLEKLLKNESESVNYKIDLVIQLLWSVLIQVFALISILEIPFGFFLGVLLTVVNLVFIKESLRLQRLLREAERRKKK